MNGICGFVWNDALQARASTSLHRMAEALRLPGGEGHVHAHDLGRVGLAVYEQLPAPRPSRLLEPDLTVVCAAELYDIAALRRQLNDAVPPEAGEAPIIAALYRRYGPECVRHLDGAFAFALWDGREERLLLATDPFAIQTLHYSCTDQGLVFGSRIKPVLEASQAPSEVDPQAVLHYLYFACVPTPHTIYAGIRKLPPGHFLCFTRAGARLEQYWDMSYADDPRPLAECAPAIPKLLAEAVRLRATYDGDTDHVGAFLSGGTDSGAITALLGEALQRPAKTFSIGFEEEEFNEISFARVVAERFRTDHHEYFVTPNDAAALLPRLAEGYEEPFGNSSAVATYCCAKLARDHGVSTLLAGDGGDELFAGNTRYVADEVFELYHRLPAWFRERCFEPSLFRLPLPSRGIVGKARKYVRRANLPQPKRFFSYNLLHEIDPREIFSDAFLESVAIDAPLDLAAQHYRRVSTRSMLHRLLYLDLKIAITDNDLRKVGRTCELAGVRPRYPMLDRRVVELSAKIPAGLKLRRFEQRHVFKEGFKQILPAATLAKKKHGFGVPVGRWLQKAPLRELAHDLLLRPASLQRGYLRPRFVEELFALHREDRTNFFGDQIWVLLMLELWHQTHR